MHIYDVWPGPRWPLSSHHRGWPGNTYHWVVHSNVAIIIKRWKMSATLSWVIIWAQIREQTRHTKSKGRTTLTKLGPPFSIADLSFLLNWNLSLSQFSIFAAPALRYNSPHLLSSDSASTEKSYIFIKDFKSRVKLHFFGSFHLFRNWGLPGLQPLEPSGRQ